MPTGLHGLTEKYYSWSERRTKSGIKLSWKTLWMVKFKRGNHLCNLSAVLKDNIILVNFDYIMESSKITGVIKDQSMQATIRPPDPLIKLKYLMLFFHLAFAPSDYDSTSNCLHQLNYSVQNKLFELKLGLNNILKQLKLQYCLQTNFICSNAG